MIKINKNFDFNKNFKFMICRHGQSIWNRENKFTGWTNISLTNKGRKDAFNLTDIIKYNNIIPTKIYTSDSKRTIESAEIIRKSLGINDVEIKSDWKLSEKHYGGCEGLYRDVVERRYGRVYLNHIRKSYMTRPPSLEDINNFRLKNSYGSDNGNFYKKYYYDVNDLDNLGENCLMVHQRVNLFLKTEILPNLLLDQIPLIVTHKHPIRVLYKSLLNMNNEDFENLDIDNKTVFLISSTNNNITIKKLKNSK